MGTWLSAVLAAMTCGCASGPLIDNPLNVSPQISVSYDNPYYVGNGPQSYNMIFDKILDILDDTFEIRVANRYDGRIETFPRIAPGLVQFWKPGSPDFDQRLEATLQTIRHRGEVLIQTADDGGFFIHVTIYKELEDLARPTQATAGAAAFRSDNAVERQFEVIDPSVLETNWIPIGRDAQMEHSIMDQIRKAL